MTTDFESKIRQAASRNAELLQILADTDNATPDLANQIAYIKDLETQYTENHTKIRKSKYKREKEFHDHEKYRDSVMRRFAYKALGKQEEFTERAKKEEQEYFQALQEEHQAQETEKNLDAMLNDAKRLRRELETKSQQNQAAQAELDGIYHSIFEGPTPGFPEEDAREGDVAAALQVYQDQRRVADAKNQSVRHLVEAERQLAISKRSMQEALSASRMDMFGGGNMADMMERSALHKAEMAISQARMHVLQAQMQMPEVRDLHGVNIAQGNIMSDVFFDNIFTDIEFHEKIHASNTEVIKCDRNLKQELQLARNRAQEQQRILTEKEKGLHVARRALQSARAQVFERVVGGSSMASQPSVPNEAPPAYKA